MCQLYIYINTLPHPASLQLPPPLKKNEEEALEAFGINYVLRNFVIKGNHSSKAIVGRIEGSREI